MARMLSVRFPASIIATIRHFACQDGMSVSEWIRKLVAAEMENPSRSLPVDVSTYPQPQTFASGCPVEIISNYLPHTVTGSGWLPAI